MYYPSSGLGIAVQHWTNEDDEVGGFVIPANSIIIPNISEVHHDPKTWGDPEVFRPERFLDNSGQFVKSERVIPSIGARRCLGESLAKSEIFLFLTGLLKNFFFSYSTTGGGSGV
jgi:vitamin D 25-hydroxylase